MLLNHLQKLQSLLRRKPEELRPTVVFGIGSELRGDDAVGVICARRINELARTGLLGIEACTAPENFTGQIKDLNPVHVIVVDAAEMGLEPGQVREIQPEDIGGLSFCTHTLPLALIIDYLRQAVSAEFTVLGIQPASLEFHQDLSEPVRLALEQVIECIAG